MPEVEKLFGSPSVPQDVVSRARILLVDDNDLIRESLGMVLGFHDFEVSKADSVAEALKLIESEHFDVLLSDLHVPSADDGLTVASVMRHAQPEAVTILFSGYPEMREAATAIVLRTDEILVKPMGVEALIETIKDGLGTGSTSRHGVESVADILDRETASIISDWLLRVELEPQVNSADLDVIERYAHLPQVFRDLVSRLRKPLPLGAHAQMSPAAAEHGALRCRQGYTPAMIVEESRLLQASIFHTLQNNLHKVDCSLLLLGVMSIADELESQLTQTMTSYAAEAEGKGEFRRAKLPIYRSA
jgi:YesN/AraC family two-component response regulator